VKDSVGDACRWIIIAHVEVYRPQVTRGGFGGVPRCPSFIYDGCGGIEKWWKRHKGDSLTELQLEAIAWVLRQSKPKEFESDREWAATKKELEKLARDIRASRKPISVEHHHPLLEVFK
jgi:hypothetical protein